MELVQGLYITILLLLIGLLPKVTFRQSTRSKNKRKHLNGLAKGLVERFKGNVDCILGVL